MYATHDRLVDTVFSLSSLLFLIMFSLIELEAFV